MNTDFGTTGFSPGGWDSEDAYPWESDYDRMVKQQRPMRKKIIVEAIRNRKPCYKIEDDLRKAGLICTRFWVKQWVKYYRWKMGLGEI
jgi:hypothetical protein